MNSIIVGLLAASALGWADVTVAPSRPERPVTGWQVSVAGLDRPSDRTLETLRRYDSENNYRHNPELVLTALKKSARQSSSEVIYAIAELSWIEARRAEGRKLIGRRAKSSIDHYLVSACFAWTYLFDPAYAGERNTTDPRYILACHLYNGSVDRILHAAKATKDKIQPGGTIRMKLAGGDQAIPLALEEHSAWKTEEVHELLLSSDYEVSGLDSRSRKFGLGVPMIGVRRADQSETDREKALDKYYPPEMAFPLTAILRPLTELKDVKDPEAIRECTIDLVDPIRYRTVGLGPDSLGMESDLTTPLAYMWSRTDLSRDRWTGLFRPGSAGERSRLMLLRPYDPDKIPVVMVHGLASSPLVWIPMLNELLREPKIHDRYQFLLYVYPTGVPLTLASAGLREALIEAQVDFDQPGNTPDREFQKMVMLGHSMGGLLSHAMVVSSANRLWELATDRAFEDISGPAEVLEKLKVYCFFEPLPFVRRVVFLATPHRGSVIAKGLIGRVVSRQITEPDFYHNLLMTLIKDNPGAFNARKFRRIPTSIDTLEPDSRILLALLGMKATEQVIFHSIIGSESPGGIHETSDGVVSYHSSHFEPVESEKIVRSGHGVPEHPAAILEVQRILLKHLDVEMAARPAGVLRN